MRRSNNILFIIVLVIMLVIFAYCGENQVRGIPKILKKERQLK
jgi:hypothetical protein